MDRWTAGARPRPTVARLLAALAQPAFLDLKLRVETLLGRAQELAEIKRIKQQFIPE